MLFGEGSIQGADVVFTEIVDALPQIALGRSAEDLGRGRCDTGVVGGSKQESTAPRSVISPVQLQPNRHQSSRIMDRRKVVDDWF